MPGAARAPVPAYGKLIHAQRFKVYPFKKTTAIQSVRYDSLDKASVLQSYQEIGEPLYDEAQGQEFVQFLNQNAPSQPLYGEVRSDVLYLNFSFFASSSEHQ